jgi:O-antigen ligase
LLAFYSVILYLTTSRAAYLAFVCILAGFLLALGLRRYLALAVVAAFITGSLALMAPALTESIVNRNIYKYASEEQGVFFTREQGLEETYNAAVEGGWIGVGYGVSVNDTNFVVGVTAVGYGREKGNAQLAIIEETGVVGLILYVILIFTVFSELVGALRACRIKEHKVLMGVFIGTLVGMIANSIFEAWWVAPGSPEFVYFCAMSGTALGVAQAIRDKAALAVAPIWQPAMSVRN